MKLAIVLAVCFVASGVSAGTESLKVPQNIVQLYGKLHSHKTSPATGDSSAPSSQPQARQAASQVETAAADTASDCSWLFSSLPGMSPGKRQASFPVNTSKFIKCVITMFASMPMIAVPAGKRDVQAQEQQQSSIEILKQAIANYVAKYHYPTPQEVHAQGKRQLESFMPVVTDPSDCPNGKPDYGKFKTALIEQFGQEILNYYPQWYLNTLADQACRSAFSYGIPKQG